MSRNVACVEWFVVLAVLIGVAGSLGGCASQSPKNVMPPIVVPTSTPELPRTCTCGVQDRGSIEVMIPAKQERIGH